MISDILGGHMELLGRVRKVREVEVQDSRPGGDNTTTHHYHGDTVLRLRLLSTAVQWM